MRLQVNIYFASLEAKKMDKVPQVGAEGHVQILWDIIFRISISLQAVKWDENRKVSIKFSNLEVTCNLCQSNLNTQTHKRACRGRKKKINESLWCLIYQASYQGSKGQLFYREHMPFVCILIGKCKSANKTVHNQNKRDSVQKCSQDRDYLMLSNSIGGIA